MDSDLTTGKAPGSLQQPAACQPCFPGAFCGSGDQNFSSAALNRGNRTKRLVGRSEFDEILQQVDSELDNLSADERRRIFQEICSGPLPQHQSETPEMIRQGLYEMQEALSKVSHNVAYDKAYAIAPEFVQDSRLRLMFLRSVEFDSQRAADRFVKHFEQKELLFGAEKLAKQITWEDLDADDRDCVKSGGLQFLPEKDRFGRPIVFLVPHQVRYRKWLNFCRAQWYLDMKTFENDEDAQRTGYIIVLYMFQTRFSIHDVDFEVWKQGAKTSESVPIRLVGLHYCATGPRLNLAFRSAMDAMSAKRRVRFRVHLGSPMECLYTLETFGIPKSVLPVDANGDIRLPQIEMLPNCVKSNTRAQSGTDASTIMDVNHNDSKQASSASSVGSAEALSSTVGPGGIIQLPAPQDVLMGPRVSYRDENPGNVVLRNLVESYTTRYNDSSKFEKTILAASLLQHMREGRARFLKRVDNGWEEVSDEVAREKISHAFRNYRRKGGGSKLR